MYHRRALDFQTISKKNQCSCLYVHCGLSQIIWWPCLKIHFTTSLYIFHRKYFIHDRLLFVSNPTYIAKPGGRTKKRWSPGLNCGYRFGSARVCSTGIAVSFYFFLKCEKAKWLDRRWLRHKYATSLFICEPTKGNKKISAVRKESEGGRDARWLLVTKGRSLFPCDVSPRPSTPSIFILGKKHSWNREQGWRELRLRLRMSMYIQGAPGIGRTIFNLVVW